MDAPVDPLVYLGYELLGSETWDHHQDWHPTLVRDRLWLGGVPDSDTMTVKHATRLGEDWSPSAYLGAYDAVVTVSALDGPAGSGVLELRAGILEQADPATMHVLVTEAVAGALRWYYQGLRVLIRCRAGLNRSGLVGTLVLMELSGDSFDACLGSLRSLRSPNLLNSLALEQLGRELSVSEDFWTRVRALALRC